MTWADYYAKTAHRPPRKTLRFALDRFDAASDAVLNHRFAVELGCGGGRDTVEMLRRRWAVLAVDAEPAAIEYLLARPDLVHRERLKTEIAPFETVTIPRSLLICSSFALPLCPPPAFHRVWARIHDALMPGGRFAGHLFGERDSWNAPAIRHEGVTFLSVEAARRLLAPFEIEMFEEEESDSKTPRGEAKHWHVMHIVARKL